MENQTRTLVLFRPLPSPRRTFTLTLDLCALCPRESLPRPAAAFQVRREFNVDMSELVYSFARGMLNIKSYPEGW